jgi:hypothetical protein
LVSLLRTSSHAQKQTPTRMAIATTVPAKTISSGTFFLLSYGCAGQKTQAIGSIGARPHHLKATASGLDGWWSRWLLDWPTGRRRSPSVRHPLRPKDGLDVHKAAWTASSRSDRTPHFCFSRKPEARLTVAGCGVRARLPQTASSHRSVDLNARPEKLPSNAP